jgi:hypothetical protein
VHLARLEALRGDSTGLDRAHADAEFATDDLVARLALHVRALGGVDRQRLQRASTMNGGTGARSILAATDPEDMERFAGQLLTPDVPGDLAAYGHRLAAYATSARGQFRSALNHLDQAQESDVDSDIEARSLIVAISGSPLDSSVIAQTRMAVESWQPSYLHDPEQSIDALARSRIYTLLRLHRLGLLELRVRDTLSAANTAARMVPTGVPDSEMTPTATASPRAFAREAAAETRRSRHSRAGTMVARRTCSPPRRWTASSTRTSRSRGPLR